MALATGEPSHDVEQTANSRPSIQMGQSETGPASLFLASALAGALLCHQEACSDVWQDLWSQCCGGDCVPSGSVLRLRCCECGEWVPVWVHQCASAPLCGSCRERVSGRWPKATWASRQSAQLSSSAWKAIQGDLRTARVDGVRCPDARTTALPLLLYWVALDGDSRILWLWHHRGSGEEAVGVMGDAACPGMGGVRVLAAVPLLRTTAVAAHWKQYSLSPRARQRRMEYDGKCDVTGCAGLTVSRTAPAHDVRWEMCCFARLPRVPATTVTCHGSS